MQFEISEIKRDADATKKLLQVKENEFKDAIEHLEKSRGPFYTKFVTAIDSFKLERQVYHKGAIVGNDVDKIFRPQNTKKLCRIFRATNIPLIDGSLETFGGCVFMDKVATLLAKLASCYRLYSPSRPLCRHEIVLLKVRCSSFGCWFPVTFPNESIIRKFHVLTYHVPEKAVDRKTVGMEGEHCSESIHPVVNKLSRTYATTQNACNRLTLIAKSQWLQSNPLLTNHRKPKPRFKSL